MEERANAKGADQNITSHEGFIFKSTSSNNISELAMRLSYE